jgi:glyoxylase-like metal-dependent hydrolase (beta-lactamase superfamily II)/8-oxo-dGTP pyrophosphatase MutT (NUDIX family)
MQLRFFGGFWAFPGGRVDPPDDDVPIVDHGSPPTARSLSGRCAAAARELFEEIGVLVARRGDGSFPPGSSELAQLRRHLCDGQLSFPDILARLGLSLHARDFQLIGGLTTPPFVATRFDTTFFVATAPPGQQPEVWPGELDDGCWASANDILGRWTSGECLLSPPTIMILEAIRARPVVEAPIQLQPLLTSLAGGAIHPIFFAPQVQLIPLYTAALPPASYTNAYLIGRDPAYLLDPGPTEPAERQRLFDLLDGRIQGGMRLGAVVLTHRHVDHIGAAAACAERYRAAVLAHPLTAEALRDRITVTGLLHEGDRLDLGSCPDGKGPWHLQALHTPGHAAGHLAFWEPHYRLLFAGDMISTLSSVVIAPPEGDLAVYLDSLRRLLEFDCRLLLPSHGGPSSRPREVFGEALTHRAKREGQLLAALGRNSRSIAEMAPELYKGTPAALMHMAELQMLAGLLKLEREKLVEKIGEGATAGWRLRPQTRAWPHHSRQT